MVPDAPRCRARNQGGFTLVELLAVVAVLAVLAGVGVVAMSGLRDDALVRACQAERRVVLTALVAARVTTVDGQYPAVLGPDDGLDQVRAAGLLAWGTNARYWNYAAPPLDGVLTGANLQRVATDEVAPSDCHL